MAKKQAAADPVAQAAELIDSGKSKSRVKTGELDKADRFGGLSEISKIEVKNQRLEVKNREHIKQVEGERDRLLDDKNLFRRNAIGFMRAVTT